MPRPRRAPISDEAFESDTALKLWWRGIARSVEYSDIEGIVLRRVSYSGLQQHEFQQHFASGFQQGYRAALEMLKTIANEYEEQQDE